MSRNLLLLLSCLSMAQLGHALPPPDSPWRDIASMRFSGDDGARLADASSTPGDKLAAATIALGTQPKTRANLERARTLLEAVIAPDLASAEALEARYLLARLRQVHAFEPDPLGAARDFLALYAAAPTSRPGQLALVRAVPIHVLLAVAPAERAETLVGLEALASTLPDADLRRGLHFALAETAQRCGEGDMAYRQYQLAEKIGLLNRTVQADVLLRIATLALERSEPDVAAAYYREFLRRFPTERRAYEVGQHLLPLGEAP